MMPLTLHPEGGHLDVEVVRKSSYSIAFEPLLGNDAMAYVRSAADASGSRDSIVAYGINASAEATSLRDRLEAVGLPVLSSFEVSERESDKSVKSLRLFWERLGEAGTSRRTMVIGVGCGVVCDVVGLAAATYMRGLPYSLVPTTMMAQVDAAIGGKTGIDANGQKNLIGAFHHPALVLIDPSLVVTLPRRVLANGLAEVIKIGMIADEELFSRVERLRPGRPDSAAISWIVRRAVEQKLCLLSPDPYETGDLQRKLNFGHTVGHALEAEAGFSWLHGECVSVGMAVATRVARSCGLLDTDDLNRLLRLLIAWGLPVEVPGHLALATHSHLERIQLVRNGALNLVVPGPIGHCKVMPNWPDGIDWRGVFSKTATDA